MTEREWLRLTRPNVALLDFMTRRVSDRRRRLFAVACCDRIRPLLRSDLLRRAVLAAEHLADGDAAGDDVSALRRGVAAAAGEHYEYPLSPEHAVQVTVGPDDCVNGVTAAAYAAMAAAHSATGDVSYTAAFVRRMEEEQAEQLRLLRDILGNPFRPVILDPAWLTSTVVGLADAVYGEQAFDRLPILADALEEAGCDNPDILSHCREAGPHVRGCWVVDLILGKS